MKYTRGRAIVQGTLYPCKECVNYLTRLRDPKYKLSANVKPEAVLMSEDTVGFHEAMDHYSILVIPEPRPLE